MVFSWPIFVLGFLPATILVYYLLPGRKAKNLFLLIASLIFYTLGEGRYTIVMIISIIINYIFGILTVEPKFKISSKIYLLTGIILNLLLLIYYKYFDFLIGSLGLQGVFWGIGKEQVHLPIGISFFTFQGLSYIIDVHRKKADCQKNIFSLALYIALFPQLIAGPIVRYTDVAKAISHRVFDADLFYSGIKRFIIGLAKKVILANNFGLISSEIIGYQNSNPELLSWYLAWFGVILYSLQIYFDFSGYSDMAIGLGRMFGFNFRENFNYPYQSKSIKEFWQRWHISLSTWFRDYVFLPFAYFISRHIKDDRIYKIKADFVIITASILLTWLLIGLWHGANWSFLLWGFFHGFFLIIERFLLSKYLKKLPDFVQWLYLMIIIQISWVFFIFTSLSTVFEYLETMFSFSSSNYSKDISYYLFNYETLFLSIIGVILSFDFIQRYFKNKLSTVFSNNLFIQITEFILLIGLLILSLSYLSSDTFNPFIYFRF